MKNLKNRLRQTVPKNRTFEYNCQWRGDSVSTDHLEQLGRDMEQALYQLIDAGTFRYNK